jgi:serine/threonine-protein kinase
MASTGQQIAAEGEAERGSHRPGDVIASRYVLDRQLSRGGMGTVWVARSKALDVDVALKLWHGSRADTGVAERMAREARAAARLGHQAIVRVIDFGEAEKGEPFIAMELLDGEELFRVLERKGRLPAAEAVSLLLPIIDGLATAHQHGIVHRDIKPENLFVARDELGRTQPKVLDFGIAKLDEEPSRLTQSGVLLGTPQYLSPEQAFGRDDIDFRTDIWSIGVVLYELTVGIPPFVAKNYNALIRVITQDPPKPITDYGAGDEQLWGIVARCLAKAPEDRWESMWALGEALALWLFERGVEVDVASRSLREAWLEGGMTGVRLLVAEEDGDPLEVPKVSERARTVSARGESEPNASRDRARKRAPRRPRFITRERAAVGFAALLGIGWLSLPARPVVARAEAALAPSSAPDALRTSTRAETATAVAPPPDPLLVRTATKPEPVAPELPASKVPSAPDKRARKRPTPTNPKPRPVRAHGPEHALGF